MQHRVEDRDDLAVHLHRVRDEHGVGVHADQALRRWPTCQCPVGRRGRWLPGTDRRAKLVEQTITDHQVGERLADRVVMDLWTSLRGFDHGRVLAQRTGAAPV